MEGMKWFVLFFWNIAVRMTWCRYHASCCWEAWCGIQTNFFSRNFHTWRVHWTARLWQMSSPTELHTYSRLHRAS